MESRECFEEMRIFRERSCCIYQRREMSQVGRVVNWQGELRTEVDVNKGSHKRSRDRERRGSHTTVTSVAGGNVNGSHNCDLSLLTKRLQDKISRSPRAFICLLAVKCIDEVVNSCEWLYSKCTRRSFPFSVAPLAEIPCRSCGCF